jgi:uncharacterized protein YjcR
MGKEIDWEVREQAADLYIVEGLTFDQVAQKTGVSVTQLKTWSADEKWREKREEYRASMKEIKGNMAKLRKDLSAKAVKSLDPQDIYAFVRLENVAGKQDKRKEETVTKIDRPALFLEAMEFIAGILKDSDPEGLKVLAKNFDSLIEKFKVKYAEAT